MKSLYLACLLGAALLVPALSRAQNVGIGTTAPDASAALDIVASDRGALLPRVASTSAVASPATGLIVYQTGTPAGFYYNAGTAAVPDWQRLQTPGNTWNLGGNAIGSTERAFGTLDANDVPLVVNGVEQGRFTQDGHLLLGLAAQNAYVKANLASLPDATSPRLLITDDTGRGDLSMLSGGTAWLNFVKYRGTVASPTAVVAPDQLGAVLFWGYNGSGYTNPVTLVVPTEGIVSGSLRASLALKVADGEALRVLANRNVGLGTASPAQLLELAGQASPTLLLHANTNNTVSGATLQFRESDPTYGWNLRHNNGGLEEGLTSDRLILENVQGPSGTLPVMSWNQASRYVGIGTSAPFSQLANTSLNIIGSDGQGGDPGSLTWSANQQGYAAMIFNNSVGGAHNGLAVKVLGNDPGASVLDVSANASQGSSGTPLLSVRADGRVGIGTNLPTQALDVAGNARVRGLAAGVVSADAGGNLSSSPAPAAFGSSFVDNQTSQQVGASFNVDGSGTVGTTLAVAGAITGSGADLGSAKGLGVRPDGGLNLGQNTSGNAVAIGYQAGQKNSGPWNQFEGYQAGFTTTTGVNNTYSGFQSGFFNVSGNDNTALGTQSGFSNATGSFNTTLGALSGTFAQGVSNNTFVGYDSGHRIKTGESNTFVGSFSGYQNGGGSNNSVLGYNSGPDPSTPDLTNATAIGANVALTASNTVVLGNGASVGIGTSTPTQLLELSGQAAPTLLLHSNTNSVTNGATLQFRESNTGVGVNLRHNNGGLEDGSTDDRLILERVSAGTFPLMVWNQNNGYVGLGTSVPFSQLANTNGNIIGSDGQGGNPGSLAWSASQTGYAAMVYNGAVGGYRNGLAVKVAGTDPNASALDVSGGADQNSTGTPLLSVRANALVGIGTNSPQGGLHVVTGNGGVGGGGGAVLSGAPSLPPYLELRGSGTGGSTTTPYIDFAETSNVDYTTRLISRGGVLNVENQAGGTVLQVNGAAQATAFNTTSDARFKTGVRSLDGALASVLALRGVRYRWNALGVQHGGAAGAEQIGILAQELEKVYPELVATDTQGYKSVNYAQLAPVLMEALKEQQAQLEALRVRVAQAEAKAAQATAATEAFEARLRRLEAGSGQAQR